jgi:uncharacterized protein YbjT (DUF2867 family)
MSRILVCGGTGFVGSAIVRELLKNQQKVRVLTRKSNTPFSDSNLEYIIGNLFDENSLLQAMKDCDVVINAAQFDNAPFENIRKGLTYEKIDEQGTKNIVRCAMKLNIPRILYISGAGVDDGKTENWFKAKWEAEKAIKNSGMNWTIFRPSWIYGSGDRSLNRMITMIRYSPIVFILGKGYRIQPVYIDDVAEVVSNAVTSTATFGQIYELGGPESMTMKQILQMTSNVLRKKRFYVSIPKSVAKMAFSMMEKLPGSIITKAALDFLTMNVSISDNQQKKVQNDFQIQFRTLKEGLQTYL